MQSVITKASFFKSRIGKITLIAVLAASLCGIFLSGMPRSAWRSYQAWRAERFINTGHAAWQRGDYREAELAFRSAGELVPGNRRGKLLLGRMMLQSRRRPEGRAVFSQMLAVEEGMVRLETATLYFDALLGTAWFDELAAFCLAEIPRLPAPLQSHWGAVLVEAVRLSGKTPSSAVEAGPDPKTPPGALSALVGARMRIKAANPASARAWLAAVRGQQLDGPLQAVAVRLALELGGTDKARLLLATSRVPLSASQLAFNELWLGAATGSARPTELACLVPRAFPAELSLEEMVQRLARLFGVGRPELPPLLAERFLKEVPKLSNQHLEALWFLWEFNRPGLRDNPWTQVLNDRLHTAIRPLEGGGFSANEFIGIINTLPLSRELVVSLLSQVKVESAQ